MAARFAKPTGEALTAAQREAIAAILRYIDAGEYDVKRLVAGIAPFVGRMSQACASDADRALMIDELERWVRWQRVPAYWLTWVFQLALKGVSTAHAIESRRLYCDAQININDDLALLSLEDAFIVAAEINAKCPDPGNQAAALSIADYLRKIYLIFRNWYSSRPYSSIEPLSEHLYNLRVFLDLPASFAQLQPEDAGNPAAWTDAIGSCAKDESYLRVIARRCAGWALEKANNLDAALEQYGLALSESTAVGLETEICHLLRYSANVLQRLNRLDQAELQLRLALRLESHPELAYWRGLSARELGRVLAVKGHAAGDLTDAMQTFNEGRELLETSLISSVVPVGRAVKQQIFRSYADDAIEVARYTSLLALLSEMEAAGPRYATDLVVESLLARQLPAEEASEFRKARAVFAQHRSLFVKENDEDDQDFIAYISAVKYHKKERDRYVVTRRRLGSRLVVEQRSTDIVERVAAMGVPNLALLIFHVAEKRTYAVLIDSANRGVAQGSIDVGIDFWRDCSDTYHAELAGAMASSMCRNQRLEAAVGTILAKYQQTLAPLVERFLPRLAGKHVKILPRLGLSEVPFHALLLGGTPLIEQADVSYVPTLGSFFALHAETPLKLDGESGAITVIHDESRTPAYTGTLHSICGDVPSRVELITPATGDAFFSHVATSPPNDLFFACHGHYDLNDPRSSSLLFTIHEEVSFARLFAELNLSQCRSVLMGACESGLGRTLVAAEYIGLPLAFLSSGVPYVIGTLWQVNRISSAMLVARHYQLVLEGAFSVPQALNAAQRYTMRLTQNEIVEWIRTWLPEKAAVWETEIRKRGELPFAHPYYWAGFYLTGAA